MKRFSQDIRNTMRPPLAGLFLLGTALIAKADLVLVDAGKPVSAIVVERGPALLSADAKADGAAKEALDRYERGVLTPARDIQDALRKMTGAEVPLIEEGAPLPDGAKTRIFVGRTDAARKAGVKLLSGCELKPRPDAFTEEGYRLQTKGNDLYIAGNEDGFYRGTAYGCYAFLERLGCRWYFPGPWGEVIPRRPTVMVEGLDVESHPDFAVRSVSYYGWVKASAAEHEELKRWGLKVGLSNQGYLYPGAPDNSLNVLLPPKEYGTNRPDFYATRQDGSLPAKGAGMLCLSNPDVLTESIKNLKEGFEGKRKIRTITKTGAGFSPPDGAPFCYCAACKAAGGDFFYPRYVHTPMSSELYYRFMTQLATAVPDKYLTAFAYAGREAPPQGVTGFPPNMALLYAPIACDVLHPDNHPKSWRRQEFWSMLNQFRRLTPHMVIRDYNPGLLLGFYVPERMGENLAANVPGYKKLGIKGIRSEGRKAVMQTWLSYYLMGKLLWNASADIDQLKTDFYATFFGAAGPDVRAWWNTIAETLVKADIQAHEDWLLTHIYTVEFTTRLHEHVTAAQAAAQAEPYRRRVEAFALIADHLEAFAAMHEAEKNLDFVAALAAAERMEADKAKLNGIYSHFIDKGIADRLAISSPGAARGYRELLEKTQGTNGVFVAALPLECPFRRDPFNRGVIMEWYAPDHPETGWDTRNTFFLWDQQEEPLTPAGDDWDGYGWYRMTVDVPGMWAGKPLRLRLGGAINECWVWVNGVYAGHRPHRLWWSGDRSFETDVTALVKPGRKNLIAVRLYNGADVGGLYRRGFLYSPRTP